MTNKEIASLRAALKKRLGRRNQAYWNLKQLPIWDALQSKRDKIVAQHFKDHPEEVEIVTRLYSAEEAVERIRAEMTVKYPHLLTHSQEPTLTSDGAFALTGIHDDPYKLYDQIMDDLNDAKTEEAIQAFVPLLDPIPEESSIPRRKPVGLLEALQEINEKEAQETPKEIVYAPSEMGIDV